MHIKHYDSNETYYVGDPDMGTMQANLRFEKRNQPRGGFRGRGRYVDYDNPQTNEMIKKKKEEQLRNQVDYSDLFG
jgi:hypothetical protein